MEGVESELYPVRVNVRKERESVSFFGGVEKERQNKRDNVVINSFTEGNGRERKSSRQIQKNKK